MIRSRWTSSFLTRYTNKYGKVGTSDSLVLWTRPIRPFAGCNKRLSACVRILLELWLDGKSGFSGGFIQSKIIANKHSTFRFFFAPDQRGCELKGIQRGQSLRVRQGFGDVAQFFTGCQFTPLLTHGFEPHTSKL